MAEECKTNVPGPNVGEPKDVSAFTMRGTMLEALLTSKVGEGREQTEMAPETLAMMLLLQGKVITSANMDCLLVSQEQVLVALVHQLVRAGMGARVKSLLEGVSSEDGMDAVSWPNVMTNYGHRDIPASWRAYTDGCVDKEENSRLRYLIQDKDEEGVMSFLTSPFGRFGCHHIAADGRTALMDAAKQAMDSVCIKMIETFGPEVCRTSHVDNEGNTALMYACTDQYGYARRTFYKYDNYFTMDVVALKLLAYGGDVCRADQANKRGETALWVACHNKMHNVAMKLVSMGAEACSVDHKDVYGNTAIMLARDESGPDFADKLLKSLYPDDDTFKSNRHKHYRSLETIKLMMNSDDLSTYPFDRWPDFTKLYGPVDDT